MAIEEMLSRLAKVKSKMHEFPDAKHAAVFCLLFPSSTLNPNRGVNGGGDSSPEEDLNVILTLRSSKMRSHAGDVSFPGGRADPEDPSLAYTALREANEEINFPADYDLTYINPPPPSPDSLTASDAMGHGTTWPPYLSKNNLLVTPIIAYTPHNPFERGWIPVPNPTEVEEIFTIKLSQIWNGERYSGKWMTWYYFSWRMHRFDLCGTSFDANDPFTPHSSIPSPSSSPQRYEAGKYTRIQEKKVWGLTARILVDIARVAFGRAPTYDFTDEVGDISRIMKAVQEGVFGTQQPHVSRDSRHEETRTPTATKKTTTAKKDDEDDDDHDARTEVTDTQDARETRDGANNESREAETQRETREIRERAEITGEGRVDISHATDAREQTGSHGTGRTHTGAGANTDVNTDVNTDANADTNADTITDTDARSGRETGLGPGPASDGSATPAARRRVSRRGVI